MLTHTRLKYFQTLRQHLYNKRWLIIALIILVVLDAMILYGLNRHEKSLEAARQNEQTKIFAAMDARIAKQKKAQQLQSSKQAEAAPTVTPKKDTQTSPKTTPPAGTSCAVANPGEIIVVINKRHCFTPLDWTPGDLVSVSGHMMRAEAAASMQAMQQAAAAEGMPFSLSSGYRSYATQQATYAYWVSVNGSQTIADTVSARPGYSEHQTGLAADLKVDGCTLECFAGTAQYQWLTQHAASYGFIQRYQHGMSSITGYSTEQWHWRYVGAAAAADMKAKNISTLEQYTNISGGDYQ